MAVQKSKVTRSRRGQRRSHDGLKNEALTTCQVTGETHRRHHVTKSGFYRGQPIKPAEKADAEE
jgi:large subunit ribosomal protein L32